MRMRSSCSACCWLKWLAARCEDSGTFRILNCMQKGLRNQDVRSRLTFRRIVNCKKQVYLQIYLVFLSSVGDLTVCVCYNFPQATSWTHPTASAQTIHSIANTFTQTCCLLPFLVSITNCMVSMSSSASPAHAGAEPFFNWLFRCSGMATSSWCTFTASPLRCCSKTQK